MKKLKNYKFLTIILFLIISIVGYSQPIISNTHISLKINENQVTTYNLQSNDNLPNFDKLQLGNFIIGTHKLLLTGAQTKTIKNGCKVVTSNLNYKIYKNNNVVDFNFLKINFDKNLNTKTQLWISSHEKIDLLKNLSAGNYTLEVFTSIDYAECGSGGMFANNGGGNFKANFTVSCSVAGALLAGNYNIPGCFANLVTAVNYINEFGIKGDGNVQFDVASGYIETTPPGGFAITATGTNKASIIFKKSGNGLNPTLIAFSPQGIGNTNDAIFKLIGADFVTIEGFTLQENQDNRTTKLPFNNMTEYGIMLIKAAPTDGAMFNNFKNNTLSLNKTYYNNWASK